MRESLQVYLGILTSKVLQDVFIPWSTKSSHLGYGSLTSVPASLARFHLAHTLQAAEMKNQCRFNFPWGFKTQLRYISNFRSQEGLK